MNDFAMAPENLFSKEHYSERFLVYVEISDGKRGYVRPDWSLNDDVAYAASWYFTPKPGISDPLAGIEYVKKQWPGAILKFLLVETTTRFKGLASLEEITKICTRIKLEEELIKLQEQLRQLGCSS